MSKDVKKATNNQTTEEVAVNVQTTPSVLERMSNAFSVDNSNCVIKLEDGTEIVQKKYILRNPDGKKDSITIYDEDIITSIDRIEGANKVKNISSYIVCVELANIQKSGKLEKMGYKTIAEFAKRMFDFEPSTANHYTKIGCTFLNSDYSVKAGLPELSVSHFLELNKVVGENGDITPVIKLFADGTLVDGMSTSKMRTVLKELSSPTAITDKSDNSTNSEEKSDNSDNSVKSTESATNTTENPTIVENLVKEFDIKVAVAQVLSHCKAMGEIVGIMADNGRDVEAIMADLENISKNVKKYL